MTNEPKDPGLSVTIAATILLGLLFGAMVVVVMIYLGKL